MEKKKKYYGKIWKLSMKIESLSSVVSTSIRIPFSLTKMNIETSKTNGSAISIRFFCLRNIQHLLMRWLWQVATFYLFCSFVRFVFVWQDEGVFAPNESREFWAFYLEWVWEWSLHFAFKIRVLRII